MTPDEIVKLYDKLRELISETSTLYDLTEPEKIILTDLMERLPRPNEMSAALLGRLLRAAAHIIERNEEIAKRFYESTKKGDR